MIVNLDRSFGSHLSSIFIYDLSTM